MAIYAHEIVYICHCDCSQKAKQSCDAEKITPKFLVMTPAVCSGSHSIENDTPFARVTLINADKVPLICS